MPELQYRLKLTPKTKEVLMFVKVNITWLQEDTKANDWVLKGALERIAMNVHSEEDKALVLQTFVARAHTHNLTVEAA